MAIKRDAPKRSAMREIIGMLAPGEARFAGLKIIAFRDEQSNFCKKASTIM
jgi:hypothetical protein